MKFIILGKFSFNHIYFLLYALFTITREILNKYLNENNNKISQYFYLMYITILSRFLAIIPHLINKRLSKRIKEESEENTNEKGIYYIYNDKSDEFSKKLFISTLKVSIFQFLAQALLCIFYFFNDKPEVTSYYSLQIYLIFNTITQYFVSYLVLNFQFYKHHYLSLGINLFCIFIFLIIDIIEIVNQKISDYQFYIYIFMRLVKLLLYAFEDNYAKQVLYTEFISSFTLMFLMAIYETVMILIFSIPFIFLKTKDSGEAIFVDFVEYLKGAKLILSIIIFICSFLYEMFLLIIIDRFSPSHLPFGFILHSLFSNIYKIIENSSNNNESKYFFYMNFIFYIILFIGAMIHNEIFIINKWGFNKNTKLFLDYKLKEERNNSEIDEDEDEDNAFDNQNTITSERDIPLQNIVGNK